MRAPPKSQAASNGAEHCSKTDHANLDGSSTGLDIDSDLRRPPFHIAFPISPLQIEFGLAFPLTFSSPGGACSASWLEEGMVIIKFMFADDFLLVGGWNGG